MTITNDRFKAKNGLDANNQTIINVGTPSSSTDAATKGYVDGLITGGTVTSVSGSSGRISSTGGTAPVLDLDTTAVTPGSYTATNLTVDAYGRITAASSTTLATVATTGAYSDLTGTPTIDTLLPSQYGNSGKFLTTNGLNSFWDTITAGTVTSVDASGGSTGLIFSGGPITTSGTLFLDGTLGIANGGTGQTTASAAFNALSPITTTGDLIIGNGTNSSTRLGIGSNGYVLTSNGTTASWQPASGGGSTSWASGTESAPGWPNTTTSGTGTYSASSTADISFAVNGKRAFSATGGSSAVNSIQVQSTATGAAPTITNVGSDTNGVGLGINITAKTAKATGNGGSIAITGGDGATTGGAGGYFQFTAGNAGTSGNGNAGYFKFIGGTATGTGTPSYFEVNNAPIKVNGNTSKATALAGYYSFYGQTTSTTAVILRNTANKSFAVPANSAIVMTIKVVGKNTTATNEANGYVFHGIAFRDSAASSTSWRLFGSPAKWGGKNYGNSGLIGYSEPVISANTTDGTIEIAVQCSTSGNTVNWHAVIETSEITN